MDCTETIAGFSSLFTEKKIFLLSKMLTLRIEKKNYFADQPTNCIFYAVYLARTPMN